MNKDIVRPDGFAFGLFVAGLAFLFIPLMLMPGVIAISCAFAYWLIMMVVKLVYRRRA